jgi:hypothetical protein
MSGYARQGLPNVPASGTISRFIGEREIAAVFRATDPFLVDDFCSLSPTGQHVAIGSCGDVVCCHCSRVFGE